MGSIQDTLVHAGRVFELADPTQADLPAEGCDPLPEQGDIILDGVSFGFEKNRSVLNNVSLVIKKEEELRRWSARTAGQKHSA